MNGKYEDIALSLLRFVAGFLFFPHGAQKLFGFLGAEPVASVLSRSGAAGIIEFFGGVLLMLGLFTRPVAFLCSGLMAFAYWIAHGPEAFWPILNRGELAVLYCFVFLYLAARGGGSYSIDSWWKSRGASR